MSPRRRVKRQTALPRTMLDYGRAVGAVLGVAGATTLTIWLIRPGGHASNQPRIATVLFGSACIFAYAFWISRGADRPVVGRWSIWGALILLAVLLVSAGYVLEETTKWHDALLVLGFFAGTVIVLGIITECGLLIRRFAQGSRAIRALMAAALALICGAIAALAWPGGIKLERPKAPSVPSPVPVSTAPATLPAAPEPPPESTP